MYIKRHQISQNINIQCINPGATLRLQPQNYFTDTKQTRLSTPRADTATSLGLGRGDTDPWQRLLVPTHAPGKGWWCPGVKHDPTYTPRSYTLLRVLVRGQEMGLDPESPIISRHVLCQSRLREPSSLAPAGSLILLTKGDT